MNWFRSRLQIYLQGMLISRECVDDFNFACLLAELSDVVLFVVHPPWLGDERAPV